MSQYVYRQLEPGLWTVGWYGPDGTWEPESDHTDENEAARRTAWLNGSPSDHALLVEERDTARAEVERLRAAGELYCDVGYPLGGMQPRVNWCGLGRGHAGMHVGGAVGVSFTDVGTVRRGGVS